MSQDRLYSKTHEWVRIESDAAGGKLAVVGLTAFALEALTDLVFVDLPPVGRQVKAAQSFGEIESVKAVSDLYSPVDGEVVEVNSAVAKNLEHLAEDPYEKGWFIKIKIADEAGLADLLDEAAYKKQCEEEQH
jgi:glycine cleavage system H protein